MKVCLKSLKPINGAGDEFFVDIEESQACKQLRSIVANRLTETASATPQSVKLIFKGRTLKDEQTLSHYGICDANKIHFLADFQQLEEQSERAPATRASLAAAAVAALTSNGMDEACATVVGAKFVESIDRRIASMNADDIIAFCDRYESENGVVAI